MLSVLNIADGFKLLGRPKNDASQKKIKANIRKRQRKRNAIEGHFGHLKEHFNLDKIKAKAKDGANIQIRLGFISANLNKAMACA